MITPEAGVLLGTGLVAHGNNPNVRPVGRRLSAGAGGAGVPPVTLYNSRPGRPGLLAQAKNESFGNPGVIAPYIPLGKGKIYLQSLAIRSESMVLAKLDKANAALQYCRMTALPISKRGTITLPPEFRQALGLGSAENPMMLAELRNGGVFLQPAEAIPVRDIPLEQMKKWIAEDERDAEGIWQRAGKA